MPMEQFSTPLSYDGGLPNIQSAPGRPINLNALPNHSPLIVKTGRVNEQIKAWAARRIELGNNLRIRAINYGIENDDPCAPVFIEGIYLVASVHYDEGPTRHEN